MSLYKDTITIVTPNEPEGYGAFDECQDYEEVNNEIEEEDNECIYYEINKKDDNK